MKKTARLFLVCAVVMGLAIFSMACGSKTDSDLPKTEPGGSSTGETGGSSAPKIDSKVYIAGTEATFAPFEWIEPNGEVVGFDVDLLHAIADEVGIQVKVEHKGWEPMFEALKNGEIEIAIAAITVTEERQKEFDFTDSYMEASQTILVKSDSTITSLQDLEGKNISVQQGTTGDISVRNALGQMYQGIKPYDSAPTAIQALLIGEVDAAVLDRPVVMEYLKANPDQDLKYITDDSFEREYYGIAVKKGNTELLDKLNQGLKAIKENGKYDEIVGKYFAE